MFIQVRLLKGFQEPLWYEVPHDWNVDTLRGLLVQVPLKNNIVPAFVEKISHERPNVSWQIRLAIAQEPFPVDAHYVALLKQLSGYYQLDPLLFIKRMRSFLMQKEQPEIIQTPEYEKKIDEVRLTVEQQQVYDFIAPKILSPEYCPVLLHGVTGSGKTEIYKKLIDAAFTQNKSAIILVPEVSLAVQFTHWFKARLAKYKIFGFHSAASIKEKRALWSCLLSAQPILIIGVHLPVLLPINNLGVIIVDEEHEPGYQEKKHPRINSKEAAILRANAYKIPIVLGSATPSVTSLHNVQARNWHFFQLKKRFAGAFPLVKQVSLLDKRRRQSFWISKELQNAIADRLAKKEQTILFLNRRGFSFFVQCSECAFMFRCQNCSVSLTLHELDQLLCHYCAFMHQLPVHCPSCKAPANSFLKKGIGTQQLVSIVRQLFPDVRIERADLDSTINKKKWQQIIKDFSGGAIDILIGTQTITKGYHFPNVTLVGVIWADLQVHFPVYNAAEVALQQLIQVSGRAGRERNESLVIVQTMLDHAIFSFISEIDYLEFCKKELQIRQEFCYPPTQRLAELELKHADDQIVESEAHQLLHELSKLVTKNRYQITVLGPTRPLVHMIKNVSSRKIYFKSASMQQINQLTALIEASKYQSSIFFTPSV